MKRVSQRAREEAIEALLCSADSCLHGRYAFIHDLLAGGSDEGRLAWLAFEAVPDRPREFVQKLEAAALLRDGWNPGDPVKVRCDR